MKAYGGQGVYSYVFQSLAVYPQGKSPSTQWTGGWVGPKTGLTLWKSENFLPYLDQNYYSSVIQRVAMCVAC